MQTIAAMYPPLASRPLIPPLLLPTTYALTLLPFFTTHRRRTALLVLPVIISACLLAPRYTFGDPSADFYRTSGFIIMPLWFTEFGVLRPERGKGAPVWVGRSGKEKGGGKAIEDCRNVWEKTWWVNELMVPSHRGIGWNWEIKNVPKDPDVGLSQSRWVGNQVLRASVWYLGSLSMLVLLGFATALENVVSIGPVKTFWMDAVIGWASAIWIYCRLSSFYSSSAAVTVALGVYEMWQLPPLMGDMRDAWSVRQFWALYHQTMRQMVSQPARRITRALGLRKGSLASGLSQLYLSFGVSCIVHQYQMFNVTRRDMGEFAFFMSQPVVITLEGAVMRLWMRYVRPSYGVSQFETVSGYAWVFLWFSFSLPIYLKGMRDAGIVRDAFLGTRPFELGVSLADSKLWSKF
ncbi:tat pathway signal sequence [Stagonosporopsis vannaccii]|nr:tat pathway signal sequence [Stagonosporopsis vannaccii]